MPDFDVPAGIRAGGAALWADLISGRDLAGGGVALATEACRIRDRLDDLARVIGGDVSTWITLRIPRGEDSPDVVEIVVDKALAEARQQANILRQIVAGLPVKGDDDGDPDGNEFLSGLGS